MRKVYYAGYVLAGIMFALMLWLCIILRPGKYSSQGSLPEGERSVYGITTGCVYIIDSLTLMMSTGWLWHTLKQNFNETLKEETNTLKTLFWIFTMSYFLRTFILFLQDSWYSWFSEWFRDDATAYYAIDIIFFSSLILWDIVPLLMNFKMHHNSFKYVPGAAIDENESDFEIVQTNSSYSLQDREDKVDDFTAPVKVKQSRSKSLEQFDTSF